MKKFLVSGTYQNGPLKDRTFLQGKEGYFFLLPKDRLPYNYEAPRLNQCYGKVSTARAIATKLNRTEAQLIAKGVTFGTCKYSVSEYNY